jgi:hypothetical protein
MDCPTLASILAQSRLLRHSIVAEFAAAIHHPSILFRRC